MSETIGSLIKMMRGRRTGFVYAHEYAKRLEAAYGEMLSEMARLKVENGEKDAEIARLKSALLTICTADKDAEGLREIAIDACNGKEVK